MIALQEPLKHRVYSRHKRLERMTIAAGFVNHNGVLMCGDTMIDGGDSAHYQSKILPIRFRDGIVHIAFCGLVGFSVSASERIALRLTHYRHGPDRSIEEIMDVVRETWALVFSEKYGNPEHTVDSQIVVSVHSKSDGRSSLIHSENEILSPSHTGVQCIGAGDKIAQYLTLWFPFSSISNIHSQHALEIAINALGRVKQYMPNAVGGSLVAVQLNHDGTENFYDAREINRIEKYTKEFDLLTRSLLLCFMDFRTSHDFDQNLKVALRRNS